MFNYILRRLFLMVPTLIGVTAIVFFVMALSPGGVGGVALNAEGQLKGEEYRRIREYYQKRFGLDQPAYVQYGRWINQIMPLGFETYPDDVFRKVIHDGKEKSERVHTMGSLDFSHFHFKAPNLGDSQARHRPVIDILAETLPITLLLNLLSIPLVYTLGIISGIVAARYRGKLFDVASGSLFLGLWSVPAIWAGVMLIGFFANQQYLNIFPTAGLHDLTSSSMQFMPHWIDGQWQPGWLLDTAWHLVLPVVCLSYGGFAYLSKLTRGSILDNLSADFVRTARAKGVGGRDVLFRHVFRNSLLSLITVAAGIIPALLGGSIIVESIFSIPGMGKLDVEAVQFRDREVVMTLTLIGGLIVLLSELLRDVCYAIADPRVSYE